ncbi:MAG: L,D-transpeptidase family protein [Rhodobacterales bacterium]|nr:L,D-transpeptidase family protein [Rhodobacterales bacterium]
MKILKFFAIALIVIGLSACSSKFKTYKGPEVTHVVLQKTQRKMYLLHNDKVLKDYDFDLGFMPVGHKSEEGDGRTPEGTYLIDRRNPESKFHLSIGISYPNVVDRAQAYSLGKRPGGDIFIHGQPNGTKGRQARDWTAGCVAVTNKEMEWIYAMVKDGTPITLYP